MNKYLIKSRVKERRWPDLKNCIVIPKKDMTWGAVHPSTAIWTFPSISCPIRDALLAQVDKMNRWD